MLELAPQYRANTWRSVKGLPHSSVSALYQDRDSYLWVGTYLGAARFDGVRFTFLAELSGDTKSVDLIESIIQTPNGALWSGWPVSAFTFWTRASCGRTRR